MHVDGAPKKPKEITAKWCNDCGCLAREQCKIAWKNCALNPTLNMNDSKYWTAGKKKFQRKMFNKDEDALKKRKRNRAALYIARCMDQWKDREMISWAYNFK